MDWNICCTIGTIFAVGLIALQFIRPKIQITT